MPGSTSTLLSTHTSCLIGDVRRQDFIDPLVRLKPDMVIALARLLPTEDAGLHGGIDAIALVAYIAPPLAILTTWALVGPAEGGEFSAPSSTAGRGGGVFMTSPSSWSGSAAGPAGSHQRATS